MAITSSPDSPLGFSILDSLVNYCYILALVIPGEQAENNIRRKPSDSYMRR